MSITPKKNLELKGKTCQKSECPIVFANSETWIDDITDSECEDEDLYLKIIEEDGVHIDYSTKHYSSHDKENSNKIKKSSVQNASTGSPISSTSQINFPNVEGNDVIEISNSENEGPNDTGQEINAFLDKIERKLEQENFNGRKKKCEDREWKTIEYFHDIIQLKHDDSTKKENAVNKFSTSTNKEKAVDGLNRSTSKEKTMDRLDRNSNNDRGVDKCDEKLNWKHKRKSNHFDDKNSEIFRKRKYSGLSDGEIVSDEGKYSDERLSTDSIVEIGRYKKYENQIERIRMKKKRKFVKETSRKHLKRYRYRHKGNGDEFEMSPELREAYSKKRNVISVPEPDHMGKYKARMDRYNENSKRKKYCSKKKTREVNELRRYKKWSSESVSRRRRSRDEVSSSDQEDRSHRSIDSDYGRKISVEPGKKWLRSPDSDKSKRVSPCRYNSKKHSKYYFKHSNKQKSNHESSSDCFDENNYSGSNKCRIRVLKKKYNEYLKYAKKYKNSNATTEDGEKFVQIRSQLKDDGNNEDENTLETLVDCKSEEEKFLKSLENYLEMKRKFKPNIPQLISRNSKEYNPENLNADDEEYVPEKFTPEDISMNISQVEEYDPCNASGITECPNLYEPTKIDEYQPTCLSKIDEYHPTPIGNSKMVYNPNATLSTHSYLDPSVPPTPKIFIKPNIVPQFSSESQFASKFTKKRSNPCSLLNNSTVYKNKKRTRRRTLFGKVKSVSKNTVFIGNTINPLVLNEVKDKFVSVVPSERMVCAPDSSGAKIHKESKLMMSKLVKEKLNEIKKKKLELLEEIHKKRLEKCKENENMEVENANVNKELAELKKRKLELMKELNKKNIMLMKQKVSLLEKKNNFVHNKLLQEKTSGEIKPMQNPSNVFHTEIKKEKKTVIDIVDKNLSKVKTLSPDANSKNTTLETSVHLVCNPNDINAKLAEIEKQKEELLQKINQKQFFEKSNVNTLKNQPNEPPMLIVNKRKALVRNIKVECTEENRSKVIQDMHDKINKAYKPSIEETCIKAEEQGTKPFPSLKTNNSNEVLLTNNSSTKIYNIQTPQSIKIMAPREINAKSLQMNCVSSKQIPVNTQFIHDAKSILNIDKIKIIDNMKLAKPLIPDVASVNINDKLQMLQRQRDQLLNDIKNKNNKRPNDVTTGTEVVNPTNRINNKLNEIEKKKAELLLKISKKAKTVQQSQAIKMNSPNFSITNLATNILSINNQKQITQQEIAKKNIELETMKAKLMKCTKEKSTMKLGISREKSTGLQRTTLKSNQTISEMNRNTVKTKSNFCMAELANEMKYKFDEQLSQIEKIKEEMLKRIERKSLQHETSNKKQIPWLGNESKPSVISIKQELNAECQEKSKTENIVSLFRLKKIPFTPRHYLIEKQKKNVMRKMLSWMKTHASLHSTDSYDSNELSLIKIINTKKKAEGKNQLIDEENIFNHKLNTLVEQEMENEFTYNELRIEILRQRGKNKTLEHVNQGIANSNLKESREQSLEMKLWNTSTPHILKPTDAHKLDRICADTKDNKSDIKSLNEQIIVNEIEVLEPETNSVQVDEILIDDVNDALKDNETMQQRTSESINAMNEKKDVDHFSGCTQVTCDDEFITLKLKLIKVERFKFDEDNNADDSDGNSDREQTERDFEMKPNTCEANAQKNSERDHQMNSIEKQCNNDTNKENVKTESANSRYIVKQANGSEKFQKEDHSFDHIIEHNPDSEKTDNKMRNTFVNICNVNKEVVHLNKNFGMQNNEIKHAEDLDIVFCGTFPHPGMDKNTKHKQQTFNFPSDSPIVSKLILNNKRKLIREFATQIHNKQELKKMTKKFSELVKTKYKVSHLKSRLDSNDKKSSAYKINYLDKKPKLNRIGTNGAIEKKKNQFILNNKNKYLSLPLHVRRQVLSKFKLDSSTLTTESQNLGSTVVNTKESKYKINRNRIGSLKCKFITKHNPNNQMKLNRELTNSKSSQVKLSRQSLISKYKVIRISNQRERNKYLLSQRRRLNNVQKIWDSKKMKVVRLNGDSHKVVARYPKRSKSNSQHSNLLQQQQTNTHVIKFRKDKVSQGKTFCSETRRTKVSFSSNIFSNRHRFGRNHLTSSRFRSVAVLTSRLRKHNFHCSVYRRYGVCKNLVCRKLHNSKYISSCPSFLKGNHQSLLSARKGSSHDQWQSKLCLGQMCPYSPANEIRRQYTTESCHFSQKGSCNCPNRHSYSTNEKLADTKCKYTSSFNPNYNPLDFCNDLGDPDPLRYFDNEHEDNNAADDDGDKESDPVETVIPKRSNKIGHLPDFISFS